MRLHGLLALVASLSFGCGSSSDEPSATPSGAAGSTSQGGSAGAAQASGGAAGEAAAGAGGDGSAGGLQGEGGTAGGGGAAGSSASFGVGPHPVGHATFTLTDEARMRTLPVDIWYPAVDAAKADAEAGVALEDLEPAGPHHDALAMLVASAPAPCTNKRTRSAEGAAPIDGKLPLVAFSHCSGCLRYSSFTLAERLASRGFAVIAADHVGNTLFDALDGKNAQVNEEFLAIRGADVRFVVDRALDPSEAALPEPLRGRFDEGDLAVFGHSFGALTTGLVVYQDARFKAGLAIAAPIELLAPTKIDAIKVPLLWLLAREDHSIGSIGNNIIRSNFDKAASPAWLVEVADSGHWSFSDVAGLTKSFNAGCGMATRQEGEHEAFSYLDNDKARDLAAGYVAAFFEAHMRGDEAALAYLGEAHPADLVEVKKR